MLSIPSNPPCRSVIALVDCNHFYCSCERVFRPELEDKPVVVLSNNDGCIIARSPEAKDLGIAMGQPYFQVAAQLKRNHVHVFSSNYALYGDLSARVMNTLHHFSPRVEVYSIDEAFIDLGNNTEDCVRYAHEIQSTVRQWTGIPVSIGIAETKTLAKTANRISKKIAKTKGVLDLRAVPDLQALLSEIEVNDIWGIGSRLAVWLRRKGIHNAWQLRHTPEAVLREKMGVVGVRLLHELQGIPCLPLVSKSTPKKGICCSRTFSTAVTSLSHLKQAVATFTARVAEKLRAQHSFTASLDVCIVSKQDRFYYHPVTVSFPVPTADTGEMISYALRGVERIFRPGRRYKKAQVTACEIVPDSTYQMHLFDHRPREKMTQLIHCIDRINRRMGSGTVQYAAMGISPPWRMKQKSLSPAYTTRWDSLCRVSAG